MLSFAGETKLLPPVLAVLITLSLIVSGATLATGVAAADTGEEKGEIKSVEIINTTDGDNDGNFSNFDVRIHADTRVGEFGDETTVGEPRLVVSVGNHEDTDLRYLDREADGVYNLSFNGTEIANETKAVTVTAKLYDKDFFNSDDLHSTVTKTVSYEPATEDFTNKELARRGVGSLFWTYDEYKTSIFNADFWADRSAENVKRAAEAANPVPTTKRGAAMEALTRTGVGGPATTTWTAVQTSVWGGIAYVEWKISSLLISTNQYGPKTYSRFRTKLADLHTNTKKIRNATTERQVYENMSEREKILRDVYNTEVGYRINVKTNVRANDGPGLLPYIEANEDDYDLFKSQFKEFEKHLIADYYWTQLYLNPQADDYTNLTVAADTPPTVRPDPVITDISSPEVVETGESVNITINVTNNGADAALQSIAASFPAAESTANISIQESQFANQSYGQVYAPGEEVGATYGHGTTTLSYPLVEVGGSWESGETKSLTVEVAPEESGSYPVYVKSIAQNGGWAAAPEIGSDGTRDQQLETVRVHQFIAAQSGGEPTAVFSSSSPSVPTDQQVSFDASNSTDVGGEITEYAWDYNGDGSVEERTTSPTATHTFTDPRTYDVTLTVHDDSGYNSTTTQTVTVNTDPTASFTTSPTTLATYDTVTFNASTSSDPDGSVTQYEWAAGDTRYGWRDGVTASTFYTEPGTYTVSLRVTDSMGGTDTTQTEITVKPPVTVVDLNVSQSTRTKEPTAITATLFNDGGSETAYSYGLLIDDELVGEAEGVLGADAATKIRFNHTFRTTGTKPIRIGNKDDPTVSSPTVNITVESAPNARVQQTPAYAITGKQVQFSAARSFDRDGNITAIRWDFDTDGDFETVGETLNRSFSEPGTHSYRVQLVDNDSVTTTTREHITIHRPHDWPSPGYNPGGSSWNPHTTGPTTDVGVAWQTKINYSIQSPIVVNDTVYVASDDRVVAVERANGTVEWSQDIEPSVTGGPAVEGDMLVLPIEQQGYYSPPGVIALDRETGEKRWERIGVGGNRFTVDNGVVYTAGGNGSALNVTTGETIWQTAWSGKAATTSDGLVFFSDSMGDDLVARYAANGTLAWQTRSPKISFLGETPAVRNGTVFAGEENLSAINTSTGDVIWSTKLGANTSPQAVPAVTNETAYVSTKNTSDAADAPGGRLYALDTATGAIEWTAPYPNDGDSAPSVAGGVVYVGSNDCEQSCSNTYYYPDGKIWAFDADTGDELWNHTTDEHIYTAPAISNGSLYIGNGSGGLLALQNGIANTTDNESDTAPLAVAIRIDADGDGSSDSTAELGTTLHLNGSASQSETGIERHQWHIAGPNTTLETPTESKTGETSSFTPTETGEYNVSLTITDADGDTQTTTTTVTVVDTTPPSATLSGPDVAIVGTPVQFNMTATDQGRIVEYLWDFDDDGYTERTTTQPSANYTYTEANQTYEVLATPVDASGNHNVTTITVTTIQRPSVTIETPANGMTTSTDPVLEYRAAGLDAADVSALAYRIDGGTWSQTEVNQRGTLSLGPLTNGTHTVALQLVNSTGARVLPASETTAASVTFTADAKPPSVDLETNQSGPIGEHNPVAITVDSSDANLETTTVTVARNSTVVQSIPVTTRIATGTTTVVWNGTNESGAPVTNGRYNITVRSTDTAGNVNTTTGHVTVDTAAPPVAITSLTTDSTAGDDSGPLAVGEKLQVTAAATGTPGNASTVFARLNATFTNFDVRVPATYNAGSWVATINASTLPDAGSYSLTVGARDAAGNANSSTADRTVRIDRTPPELGATVTRLNATMARLAVTTNDTIAPTTLKAVVTHPNETTQRVSLSRTGTRYMGTFPLSEQGNQYTVTASAADPAGNQGSDTTTVTIETVSTTNRSVVVRSEAAGAFVRLNTSAEVNRTFISLSESDAALDPLAADLTGVSFLNGQLGQRLSANLNNATIGIPVQRATLPAGVTPTNATVRRYNELQGGWTPINTTVREVTTPDGTTATYWIAHVQHFSTYGVVADDTTKPTISTRTPSETLPVDTTTTTVRFEYDDTLSGINASAVELFFNGTRVTNDQTTAITNDYSTYRASGLSPNQTYSATIRVPDVAGNVRRATTEFTVVEDATRPDILELTPQNGTALPATTDQITIRANYTDLGSGINPDRVRAFFNGSPISDTHITADQLAYTATGLTDNATYTIRLNITDHAGLHREQAITFRVNASSEESSSGGSGGGFFFPAPSEDTTTTALPTTSTTDTPTTTSTTTTTPTTTQTQTTTVSESGPSTTTSSARTTDPATTNSPGTPGFGFAVSLVALLALSALQRRT